MCFYDKDRKVRLRLSFEPKERFPEKLFHVANDNFLIKWGFSGESVVVDPEEFEANVLKCYPGFLQISSFANLRRLFRQYAFDWKINYDETFEFSHEFFVRGHPQLLEEIVTRRKTFSHRFYNPQTERPKASTLQLTSTPLNKQRTSLRRSTLEAKVCTRRYPEESDTSLRSTEDESHEQLFTPSFPASGTAGAATRKSEYRERPKLDPAVLDVYARNELTEDEILMLLKRRDTMLGRLERPDQPETPGWGCEWMYMFWDVEGSEPETWTCQAVPHNRDDLDCNVLCEGEVGIGLHEMIPLRTLDQSPVTQTDPITVTASHLSGSGVAVSTTGMTSPCCSCRCHTEGENTA